MKIFNVGICNSNIMATIDVHNLSMDHVKITLKVNEHYKVRL